MANLTLAENPLPSKPVLSRLAPFAVAGLAATTVGIWLYNTPPGLLGKADAIAFAICHRLVSHSIHDGRASHAACARAAPASTWAR